MSPSSSLSLTENTPLICTDLFLSYLAQVKLRSSYRIGIHPGTLPPFRFLKPSDETLRWNVPLGSHGRHQCTTFAILFYGILSVINDCSSLSLQPKMFFMYVYHFSIVKVRFTKDATASVANWMFARVPDRGRLWSMPKISTSVTVSLQHLETLRLQLERSGFLHSKQK